MLFKNYTYKILLYLFSGPLHIPAKRPGFETDPSVIRHPHATPWGFEAGFESQYHTHQYYLDRDRKPVYYYPESQFPPQVG